MLLPITSNLLLISFIERYPTVNTEGLTVQNAKNECNTVIMYH